MNSKFFIALLLSLLAGACDSQEQHSQDMQAHDMQALIANCAKQPPAPCVAANPKNKVTINTKPPKLKVVPPTVCAEKGKDIEVTIKPKDSTVLVVTVPKDSDNGWILATNAADPLKMTISVPDGTADELYHYLVITGDGKCLDPRIRVR